MDCTTSAPLKEKLYEFEKLKDLTFHNDRGTQYTAQALMLLLKNLSVTQSFSPSGKPYHNAVMESFFSTLKKEEIYRTNYASFNHFKGNIENTYYFTTIVVHIARLTITLLMPLKKPSSLGNKSKYS